MRTFLSPHHGLDYLRGRVFKRFLQQLWELAAACFGLRALRVQRSSGGSPNHKRLERGDLLEGVCFQPLLNGAVRIINIQL